MTIETEKKFLRPDLVHLRKNLSSSEARFISRAWERNLVLDRPDRTLRRADMLLRLRRADTTTLTLKRKPRHLRPGAKGVKAMEEWETVVGDERAMLAILEGLGFVIAFKYEKFRETWQWGNCVICLDVLPFMEAVEIEGGMEEIDRAAAHFGLDALQSSTRTYHQLYQERRKALGLAPEEDYVFSKEQKARLMNDLCR